MKKLFLEGITGTVLLTFSAGAQTTTVTQPLPNGGTITTTRNAPNYAHRAEIENDIDNGIAIGISLYERHQEQKLLHNEQSNELEGLYQSDYQDLDSLVVVNVPVIAVVTSTPQLHGHSLGETWQQFVSENPKLKASVTRCEAQKPLRETRKHQVYDPCAAVRYMQNDPKGSTKMTCRNANFMLKDVMCSDFDGEVTFADGELVKYKYAEATHWKGELANLTSEFGRPSGVDKNNSSAIWRTSAYSVAAEKIDGGIAEVLETATQLTRTQAEQKEIEAANEDDE
jgi:hypothetical protein